WGYDRRLGHKSRMRRELPVRFREGLGVQLPRATRLVMCFERRDDAERVLAVLGKRLERFGLKRHPDKTRLICFERPVRAQQPGEGPDSFDSLGFTVHWRRSLKGQWVPTFKPSGKRLRRAMDAITDFCRDRRHEPVQAQHAGLVRRLL